MIFLHIFTDPLHVEDSEQYLWDNFGSIKKMYASRC